MALLEDLGRPKRAFASAYQFFFKEQFTELHKKGSPIADTAKAISELWNPLTPEQREPYISKSNKIKEEYNAELEAWKIKMKVNEEGNESIAKMNKTVNRKYKNKKRQIEAHE